MTRILLCVDLSYQVYRASAAHSLLTSRRRFTGGLYGFFTSLAKMIRETQATDIAFCQDVKPYKRSALYPEYKQLRKAKADDELLHCYKESMPMVLDALYLSGFPVWGIKGFESDDLIAHAVRKYRHRYDMIYAASNDSDLWQLLDLPRFAIYRSGIKDLVTADYLHRSKRVTPQEYMLMTAYMGTHNDVEGIPKVGEVTAYKIVKDPALMRKYRERYAEIVERNLRLIKLPHDDFPHDAAIPAPIRVNLRELWRYLSAYDIDVTGAMERSLEQVSPPRSRGRP